MFKKNNTRILFINGDVVVLNKVQSGSDRCQIFVGGVKKGFLIESNGIFVPEGGGFINANMLIRINELARPSKAA